MKTTCNILRIWSPIQKYVTALPDAIVGTTLITKINNNNNNNNNKLGYDRDEKYYSHEPPPYQCMNRSTNNKKLLWDFKLTIGFV